MRLLKNLSSFFLLTVLCVLSPAVLAEYKLNMTQGVTPTSHAIYGLHMMVFWICVAIGIVVFSMMMYSLIMHRKSRGAVAAQFHEHTTVEVIWAIIPFIILVAMAIPATRVLLLMDDESDSDMNIKITGYQWKWHYDYIDDGIKYFSNLSTPAAQIKNQEPKGQHYLLEVDRPLVVPVNKKIRFFVTSNDVIHSWWVPAFGVKRDAVPGFIHEAWAKVEKPGIYRGQCAELCGVNHGFMPIVVEAKTEEDYQAWINEQKKELAQKSQASTKTWTKEELMQKGEQEYLTYCSACHQPTGLGLPPTFPALKGSKIATGPIAEHIDRVLNGVKGTAMQAFGGQLSEDDLAAIITYERNAWGNNMGDVVQPTDIIVAKGGTPPAASAATKEPAIESKAEIAADKKEPATAAEEQDKALSEEPAPVITTLDTYREYDYDDLMKMGEEVYLRVCAVCHQPNGKGIPPTFPSLADSKIVNGTVEDHIDRVTKGVKGTAMQSFTEQLNPLEIAAVITYERNAWKQGGDKETVQPKDVTNNKDNEKGE